MIDFIRSFTHLKSIAACRLCDRKRWYNSQLILAMPQGYRAKDHVIIKTYSGSSRPQSVFDWISSNLASRVHQIRDLKQLDADWYQFERKSEKVSYTSLSLQTVRQLATLP